MRKLAAFVAVPSIFTLVAACSSAPVGEPTSSTTSAVSEDAPQHVHPMKGAKKTGGGGSSNLLDHGGPVVPASHVYTFWWGTPSAFPSDAQSGLDAMFEGMNGTSFLGIADQYMHGAAMSTGFVSSYSDSASAPPSRSPATSVIVNEACSIIGKNGLTPDPDAVYVVYTSNFPGGHVNFCAWHSHGTCNGVDIKVAYMPNTTGIAGCDPGTGCSTSDGYSQGTRSLANVSSHEYMETLTDPDLNAWYDSGGSEIGDKCAWQFNGCANLKTGSWMLQEEWSNSAGGCVQN